MDDKTKVLLCRVLDMDEGELRAALIAIVEGIAVEDAIDGAFNYLRREAQALFRKRS